MSSVFLAVDPSKIIPLYEILYPKKEHIILFYIGYHNIAK